MPLNVYGNCTEQSRIRDGIRAPRHCTSKHVKALHFTARHISAGHFNQQLLSVVHQPTVTREAVK